MRYTRPVAFLASMFVLSSLLVAQPLAVKGGRVIVAPGEILEGATLLVVDGKITAVGTDLEIPAGARIVDATGKVVLAMFLDGRTDGPLDPAMRNVAPSGAGDRAADALAGFETAERDALLAAGIGGGYVAVPASRGVGMTGAVCYLDPTAPTALVVEEAAGVEFAIGERGGITPQQGGFPGRGRRPRADGDAHGTDTEHTDDCTDAACDTDHGHEGESEGNAHADHDHGPLLSPDGREVEPGSEWEGRLASCGCLADSGPPPALPATREPMPFPTLVSTPYAPLDVVLTQSSVQSRSSSKATIDQALTGAKRYRETFEKYEKALKEHEKKLAEWEKSKKGGAPKDKPAAPAEEAKKPEVKLPLPDGWKGWTAEQRVEWMRDNMRRGVPIVVAKSSTSRSKAKPDDGRPKPPAKPATDLAQEALLRVVDRAAPLRIEAHWKQDILQALELGKSANVSVILVGATEAWRVLDEIKDAGAMVVLGSSMDFAKNEIDLMHHRADLAQQLATKGIPFAFMTAGVPGFGSADLGLIAALAMGEGLSEDAALRALTVDAAKVLGVSERVGTLRVGQDARIQILTSDPLAPNARVETLILGTEVVHP